MTNNEYSPTAELPIARNERRGFRFQFGLRALLVFTLLVGIGGGVLVPLITRANRQRELVKRLLAAGFTVQYDHGLTEGEQHWPPRAKVSQAFWQEVLFWHPVVQVHHDYSRLKDSKVLELIAQLPDLEYIEIYSSPLDKPATIPRLACRERLKLFVRMNHTLSPDEVLSIAECKSLVWLDVHVDDGSNRELSALDGLEQLKTLRIRGPIAEEAVAKWQNLPQLESLYLDGTRRLSDKTVSDFLRRMPNLRQIELHNISCTNEICEALATCQNLRQLWLVESRLDDEGLGHFRNLHQLEELRIAQTHVWGYAFKQPGGFRGLRHLYARDTRFDDEGASFLANLPQLQSVGLRNTRISNAACEHLGRCQLEWIDLSHTRLSDRGASALNSQHVKMLDLSGTDVSALPFAAPTQWPLLETLYLGRPPASEEQLESILAFPKLKQLIAVGKVSPAFGRRHGTKFLSATYFLGGYRFGPPEEESP